MEKSLATVAGIEFRQCLEFISHSKKEETNLETRRPGKGNRECSFGNDSLFPGFMDSRLDLFQFRQFCFDFVEVRQLFRIVVALGVLNHAVLVDDEGVTFRYAGDTETDLLH